MQRHLSVISGEHAEVLQLAQQHLRNSEQVLWITQQTLIPHDDKVVRLPANKARTVLGHEFFTVVYDAWSGLDVNALAAVVGTICAGGTLVLLTPPLNDWPEYADPDYQRFLPYPWRAGQLNGYFLQRFVRLLADCPLQPLQQLSWMPPAFVTKTSADQVRALSVILQAQQAVVLTAERGRGKSALLGMVAQNCLSTGSQVLLTAPSRATAATVFEHAELALSFIAPDDLLQALPLADVLLVDEAAAIPVPLLIAMQQHYPRCVFATTVQGYEGSGRGFVLRFQKALDEAVPEWQSVALQTPIRWQQGDWLEGFINRLLILDAKISDVPRFTGSGHKGLKATPPGLPLSREETSHLPATLVRSEVKRPPLTRGGMGRGFSWSSAKVEALNYQTITQAELANNEPLLRNLFSLLVSAHYQTRPSDLRQMLDAPQISIQVLMQDSQIIAVALLSREGELDPALVAGIHTGQRRPQGHMLAQSLTFHAGISGAACLHGQRIMRIAVHPDWQRQGVGQQLLAKVQNYAWDQQADYLGVSYALSLDVLAFWHRAGFQTARLGFRKDSASGARSLMQIKGLSTAGIMLTQQANQVFRQHLPAWLQKLGDVPDAIVQAISPVAETVQTEKCLRRSDK